MEDRVIINKEEHIAEVILNRADKLNALDGAMIQAIIAAGEEIQNDEEIRVVVLRGEGKAFCAGIDLSNFDPSSDGVDNVVERTHGVANKWQQCAWVWRDLDVPVIAAVHGICFGGGLNVMSGADIKYITADARLSILEMKWGIIPDMAGSQLWRHNVREDIVRELTYTHREFSGTQAVEYGFATHVSNNPLEDARSLAKVIASKSPSAIVKSKKMFNQAPYLSVGDGLKMESVEQEEILRKHNQLEAVFSTMQKRDGKYKNYREHK